MVDSFREVDARDHASTRRLVYEAFRDNEPEETAVFLDALRNFGCILGEWLAEDEKGPAGYIAFSRVWLEQADGNRFACAILTPLAVRPDSQRRGIGMRLMECALGELEKQGETLFFVLGHPSYYPRAGFRPAFAAGFLSQWGDNTAFMVRGRPVASGKLILPQVIADAH